MPVADFRPESVGGRPSPWKVPGTSFLVRGVPSLEIEDTPAGPNGVTAHAELLIELPALVNNVAVGLVIGNAVVVEALDVTGAVVDSQSFAAGLGTAAAVLSATSDVIHQIRMTNSATEDRITIVFFP